MCAVSMIGDDWSRRFPNDYPGSYTWILGPSVSQKEFDEFKKQHAQELDKLRAEITALKDLLKAAKIYDEQTGQPNCELDEKIALLKKIAELVGVNLEDVFGKST